MTDKKKIIDGCDVSGCEFCDYKSSNIPQCRIRLASFEPICEGYNCYYKQLKAKEQECEELKERLYIQAKEKVKYIFELDKLKATLTEIEKLAIQGNVYCVDYNIDDCEKCIKQSDCKTTLFKQILQKISECEGNDE